MSCLILCGTFSRSLIGDLLLEVDLRKAARSISKPDAPQLCAVLTGLLEWEGGWEQWERDLAISIGRPYGQQRQAMWTASNHAEGCSGGGKQGGLHSAKF
jgi:hypothetical protein